MPILEIINKSMEFIMFKVRWGEIASQIKILDVHIGQQNSIFRGGGGSSNLKDESVLMTIAFIVTDLNDKLISKEFYQMPYNNLKSEEVMTFAEKSLKDNHPKLKEQNK
jgi:hypothetical protein